MGGLLQRAAVQNTFDGRHTSQVSLAPLLRFEFHGVALAA